MEEIIYVPSENTDSIKLKDQLLNPAFGWGAPPFGLMGALLMAMFNPSFVYTHPFTEINDEEFLEKFEKASTPEEKEDLIKSNATDYWNKVLDKVKNPDPEAERRLDERLKEINEQIDKLSKQRQDIIDDWVME